MANYNVTITNGSGSESMIPGTYSVSVVSAPGYETGTLSPTSFTATSSTQTGTFTISAAGTLTITFNETGATGGTPITSGTVVMTDSTGETEYGSSIEIDSNGTATFNNVPYGSAQSPYTLYFKQLTSDSTHDPYANVLSVEMESQTQQEYVVNALKPVPQNFTLTDSTYTGLPINSAELSFEG